MNNKYKTKLTATEERQFRKWYKEYAVPILNWDINPDASEHQYDIRGYWKEHKYDILKPGQHFLDTWKTPGHPTFSIESKYYEKGMPAGYWEGEYYVRLIDDDEIARRQRYAESAFNNNAVSGAGAKWAYQIMPVILQEYIQATGKIGDLYDYEYNKQVRDWLMNRLSKNPTVNSGESSDSVKTGRQLYAYFAGAGNLKKVLDAAKRDNVDLDNSFEWPNYGTKNGQNYVNFIERNQDVNDHLNNDSYQRLVRTEKEGGEIPIAKSGIHIKPENKGKLTRLKKRTGKSEAELWKTGSPAVRKMITFARNSRKWKH